MDEAELAIWRAQRLDDAVTKLCDGNKTAFGKLMGFSDGAYIRQMVVGKRPITEKLIRKVEAQRGMAGWFEPISQQASGEVVLLIRNEVASRDIPDHILHSLLEMIRGFPVKKKVA